MTPGMRPTARGVLLTLAAVFPVAYLAVAVLRMAYPFDLEWIEGWR